MDVLGLMMAEWRGIAYCPRCLGTHAQLYWSRFTSLPSFGQDLVLGWAMCPVLNEPIFYGETLRD